MLNVLQLNSAASEIPYTNSHDCIVRNVAHLAEKEENTVKMMEPGEEESEMDIIEPETVQAMAWLDAMYEDSGLTATRAHEAASIIQVSRD